MKVDPSKKTVESSPITGAEAAGYALVVQVAGSVVTLDLPRTGYLDIGRDESCALALDDESVSRHHARLHGGAHPQVEDLGSTNGTRLLGAKIPPGALVPVRLGAVIEFGNVVAFVRERGQTGAIPPIHRAAREASASESIVVRDARMRELYELLDIVAPSPFPVLILGETGVGKDIFAEALHKRSTRASRPLMRLNCAALAESLLESELFGHEKGAFTGAVAAKEGLFEAANGGTVFLDEIGEMPLASQAKLLRVLESGEVMRVGSVRAKTVDVRFVAATNRDLPAKCESGAFRSDLYFRLSGVVVTIPPLRERPEELPLLVEHFARDAARRLGRDAAARFTPAAIAKIRAHDWPGNIRELRNAVERAVLLARGDSIDEAAIAVQAGPRLASGASQIPPAPAPSRAEPSSAKGGANGRATLDSEIRNLERQRIVEALDACGGNQSRAAKMLGMPRRSLLRRIEEFGLVRPRKSSAD